MTLMLLWQYVEAHPGQSTWCYSQFCENDRPVRTASSEQVRQPIYRDGVEHWRHFEPWLGPLKAALGPVLQSYPEPPEFPAATA